MVTRPTVAFSVIGKAVPQGSKRMFKTKGGALVMVESSKGHKSWRVDVSDAAREVAPSEPFDGPVEVTLDFRFLPVAGDPYRTFHATTPDSDKIARAVLDALKVARVVVDDSRVCRLLVTKRYCESGEAAGVDVTVADLSGEESDFREAKKALAAVRRKAAKAASV